MKDPRRRTLLRAPSADAESVLHRSRQVEVSLEDRLKHASSIHCDALVSLPKAMLTDPVSTLATSRLRALDQALRVALALG